MGFFIGDIKMNVLSLCDGMSGGMAALQHLGIKPTKYFASEIDKYAESVSRFHYPEIIRLGNIYDVNYMGLPPIDLLICGFPCQSFSFAGKQLNFEDPRGKIFFEVVRLLNELQPKYFLLENVIMKKDIEEKINELIGVKPVVINSALLTAQNRKRNYWVGGYKDGKVYQIDISQPEDIGILLKDIIVDGEENVTGGAQRGRYLDNNDKQLDSAVKSQSSLTEQRIELRNDGKSNCLTSVQKDSLCVQVGNAGITNRRRDDAVYSVVGKNPTLMAMSGGQKEPKISTDNITWRKLVPVECERLQSYPDNYTTYGIDQKYKQVVISNSQRYKMIGNGFTMLVIAHILKSMDMKITKSIHKPAISGFFNIQTFNKSK